MQRIALPFLALGLSAQLAAGPLTQAAGALTQAAGALTQADAIRAALHANSRLEAARASREAAGAQVQQARWDQLGRLDLGWQWNPSFKNRELNLPTAPPMRVAFGAFSRNQFDARFTQPLWTWGALSGRAQAARLREAAEGHLETREAQLVAYDASLAFLQAHQAQEAVTVAELSLAQQEAFLLNARARVAQGASARLDVLKADLSLSEAESRLIAARNQQRSTRETLVMVTKDDRFRMATLQPSDAVQQDLPGEAEAMAQARAQRPDLKGATRQGEALRAGALAEQASGLPTLNLQAALSQASDHTDGFSQASNRTYSVGLAIQWEALAPRRAQLRRADLAARAQAQEAQTRALDDRLALEVRQARWRIEQARAQIEVAQRALQQAEEQARVSRVAYQEGLRTAVERQGDEVALSDARYRRLSAHLELGQAWASLHLALGSD